MSSFLFIICILILANDIDHNPDIKGLNINGKEVKQKLFADDATYVQNGTKESFTSLVKTLIIFLKYHA